MRAQVYTSDTASRNRQSRKIAGIPVSAWYTSRLSVLDYMENVARMTAFLTLAQAAGLFALTALAEISGSYLVYLTVKQGRPVWLLLPAALCIILFVWLLTLHPGAAGRTYAAYGGMYIAFAFLWLRVVEGKYPNSWEVAGVLVSLVGMGIIILAPQD